MHVAILTFEGYNELDSLIALGILNRITDDDWRVTIATPAPTVTSMNGVVIEQMSTLEDALEADAVIVGSGVATREVVEDSAVMDVLRRLDPSANSSPHNAPALSSLPRLGLLDEIPACTDLTTRPWVVAAGVEVLNQPFFARDNVATAGGCLARSTSRRGSSPACAAKGRRAGVALRGPVGEKEEYIRRARRNITPYLPRWKRRRSITSHIRAADVATSHMRHATPLVRRSKTSAP